MDTKKIAVVINTTKLTFVEIGQMIKIEPMTYPLANKPIRLLDYTLKRIEIEWL